MKNLIIYSCCVAAGIALTLMMGMFRRTDSAFINTQKVFEAFEGKKERDVKFQSMQQNAKSTIDSMILDLKQMPEGSESHRQLYGIIAGKQAESQSKLEEQLGQYNDEIWRQVNQYVYDYGKENNYHFIFGASGNGSLMYSDESKDITEKVIKYVNDRYNGQN